MKVSRETVDRRLRLAILLASTAIASQAAGADSTWTGGSGSLWNDAGNWNNGVPGNNSGAAGTSADLAFFTGLVSNNIVSVDFNRNIHTMQFGSIALPDGTQTAYTIGAGGVNAGNVLHLSQGGAIHVLSTFGAAGTANEGKQVVVNAPMRLTGTSYSFISDAGDLTETRPGLALFGTITAGAGAPTTLTFSTVGGTRASSRNECQSPIADGPGGAIVTVVKNGPGTWEMNQSDLNPNTYSGDTIINAGCLRASTAGTFNGLGGFSPNSHYIVNSGAEFRSSVAGATIKAITINAGGTFSVSTAASTTLNFSTGAAPMPAIHLNYVAQGAGTFNTNAPINLLGTLPLHGGIKLSSGSLTGHASIGATNSVLDIGTVLRTFDVGDSGTANSYDLRINGPVTGGGPNGGIVKTGPGLLRFESAQVGFQGKLEIREGIVQARVDNAFTQQPALEITGGFLDVLGSAGSNTFSFGPVTITKGGITAGSSITSTVRAPSFVLNIAAGDSASVGAVLAETVPGATLLKSGAGAATLTGNNSYTGLTTVSGGTLFVNTNSEDVILDPLVGAGANITAGRIVFDYTNGTSPQNQIVPLLDAGFDVNFASGRIKSTTAVVGQRGLGWKDDTGASAFTVAHTRYGDANLDFITSIGDFSILASNFNAAGGWPQGDFNYDGNVNLGDFALLASNFNLVAGDALARSVVPEPGSAAGITAVGVILMRRRRRDHRLRTCGVESIG